MRSDSHVKAILWVLAASLLVYWFVGYVAHSLIDAQHNPTVYHYKVCPNPNPTFPTYGGR